MNYLEYDGETIKEVVGTIPTTSIGNADGSGSTYQDVNLLTGLRKNFRLGDGETKKFKLDAENIDSDYTITAKIGDLTYVQGADFTVNVTEGSITFNVAPPAPTTDGQHNIEILFRKTIQGYRDRIDKCTILTVFDNRIFFSGNQDYPNAIFHSSLEDPRYISDLDYYNEGMDLSPVKALVPGNNALWVFKELYRKKVTKMTKYVEIGCFSFLK